MPHHSHLLTRLLTLQNQIKAGTVILLLAFLFSAFTFLTGLHQMLAIVTWNAQAHEATNRLNAIDRKLLDEMLKDKASTLAIESLSDDVTKLDTLLGADAQPRLAQFQSLLDNWHGQAAVGETAGKLRGQVRELLQSHSHLVAQKQAEAERLNQRLLITALALCGLVGTLLLLFSGRLSRQITEPTQQMLVAMERVALGEVAPKVEERSVNEFGQLARAFNQMAAKLSERQTRNRELDELYYFNTMLQTSESETEIHRALLQQMRTLNLSQALILDWDKEIGGLVVMAALYPLPEPDASGFSPNYQIPLCRVVRAGREVVLPNLSEDMICTNCHFGQKHGSAYCVPIISGGKPIGALHLVSPHQDYWTSERQRFIKAFVDQSAAAINNLRLMDQLRGRALMDEQTQVHNRRYLDDYLHKQLAVADRQRRHLSVMMIDIDYFKRFNDTYGHEAGDVVLKHFAQALKGALREGELIARYGGEEFTVVMHGNAREAMTLAERLRRAVASLSFSQFTNNGEDVKITMSIGIAEFPNSGHTLEEILKAADLALYQAKDAGRNCVKVATRTLMRVRAALQ
ncbi:MAG TPA: diguanylate cyclase [Blastocatellia bacterium]|nr:diguanylate cyclase [Blastocatellia bacterium]